MTKWPPISRTVNQLLGSEKSSQVSYKNPLFIYIYIYLIPFNIKRDRPLILVLSLLSTHNTFYSPFCDQLSVSLASYLIVSFPTAMKGVDCHQHSQRSQSSPHCHFVVSPLPNTQSPSPRQYKYTNFDQVKVLNC